MKKRKLAVIAVLAAALCLSSCGTSTFESVNQSAGSYSGENAGNGYYDSYASEETEAKSADEEYSGDAAAAGDAGDPGSGDSALRAQDGQKIVYTGTDAGIRQIRGQHQSQDQRSRRLFRIGE